MHQSLQPQPPPCAAGYHELVTGSSSYQLEDKGTFLLEGDRLGLPVSPFFRDAAVFVKHKSIEGGMGIHVYRWVLCGGGNRPGSKSQGQVNSIAV